MAARPTAIKGQTTKGRMVLPGAAGPQRKRFCVEHDEPCKAVKIFGTKGTRFHCGQGCDLGRGDSVLK